MGVAKIIEGVQRKKKEGKTSELKESTERDKERSAESARRIITNEQTAQEH